MKNLFLFLILSLVGCATNQKTTSVRLHGYKKLAALTNTLEKNIDKTQAGYYLRLKVLYERLNNKEFQKKLQALADTSGKADVQKVWALIKQWEEVKERIEKDLILLRQNAASIKIDLAKIRIIHRALTQLATIEADSSKLNAMDIARVITTMSSELQKLELNTPSKDPGEQEFNSIVKRLTETN